MIRFRIHFVALAFLGLLSIVLAGIPDTNPDFNQTYVAVWTQPNTHWSPMFDESKNWEFSNSYLATSYIKYIESSGAQAVVLPWDLPWEEYEYILSNTHGIVFPGGEVDLFNSNKFTERMDKTLAWVRTQNDKGKYYFVVGICMGFQIVLQNASGNRGILSTGFADWRPNSTKKITNNKAIHKSDFFGTDRVSNPTRKWLQTEDGLLWQHDDGISVKDYQKFMGDKHYMIAKGSSPKRDEFAAITMDKIYPIYAVQFHPEKSAYEKRWKVYRKLNRDPQQVQGIGAWMSNMVRNSRARRNYEFEFINLPPRIKNYFSWNYMNFPWTTNMFESVILLGDMSSCDENSPCHEYVISEKMEQYTIDLYKHVKKITTDHDYRIGMYHDVKKLAENSEEQVSDI